MTEYGGESSGEVPTAMPTAGEIQQAPAASNTPAPAVTAAPTLPPATGTPPPALTPTMTPCPTPTTAVATPTSTPTQHPYEFLPSEKPTGVTGPYGDEAWAGLVEIQRKGGFWGDRLDEREALILIINHELEYQVQFQSPRDVIINQYNNWCKGGTWSANCINQFWGYSQVIKQVKVCCNGSERLPNTEQYVANFADSILNGTAVAQNPSLMHYGNALVDRSAQLLYRDYQVGIYTYASYVVPTFCSGNREVPIDPNNPDSPKRPCTNDIVDITGVFVLQTGEQNGRTGTLHHWIYPEP